MSEILARLADVNLALGAAIALVLLLRLPARRMFGPRIAYGLWMLVPLSAAAMIAPARVVTVIQPAQAAAVVGWTASAAPAPGPDGVDPLSLLLGIWALGAAASLGLLTWRQARFDRAERAGRAGPAAVGLLKLRVVTPADFEGRYSPRERQVILAHERAHIRRQDPRTNALVAAARCAVWFNPLVHLMGVCLRIDQELACDAEVVAAHPTARRAYAEAMLKTQLAARPLPLGCYWPAAAPHPLAARIALLAAPPPGRLRRTAGAATVLLLAVGAASATWLARDPQVVVRTAPAVAAASPPSGAIPAPPSSQPQAAAVADWPAPSRPAPPAAEPQPLAGPEPSPPSASPASDPRAAGEPDFKVHGVAERSRVAPGYAVRVVAAMTDPEGPPVVTDLTAFGSQRAYRTGRIENGGSRYRLFTSVAQEGDLLHVLVSLNRGFGPRVSGAAALASGQTGTIELPNGFLVTVTPFLRPETAEEADEARRWTGGLERRRLIRASFPSDPFRCGRSGALC